LTGFCFNDNICTLKKEVLKMKKIASLFVILTFLTFSLHLLPGEKELLKKVRQLYRAENYPKALELIDKGLTEHVDSEKLLAAKFSILEKLDRWEEALNTAIKRADAAKRKSPWHCIDIVTICLKLKNLEKAYEWLNRAVDRGFLSYTELDNDEFSLLKKDKRFNRVIETIKNNIGIGKPAKDFTIDLLSGEKFVLSRQKGKVILIDFWATWCGPCVKGIPYLKKLYHQHHDRGFEIIGISLDSNKKDVEDYIAGEGIKWKISYSGGAWNDATARYYHVNLIPSYWLIDRNGVLRDFGIPLRDKETMKKSIEKLISQAPVLFFGEFWDDYDTTDYPGGGFKSPPV
jgi:thiol-disulfide isomerase/thioredoxin